MEHDGVCGAPLPGGRRCQVRRDRCRWHGASAGAREAAVGEAARSPRVRRAAGSRARTAGRPQRPAGLAEHDPRGLAWALLERLLDGTEDARTAATAAALLRLAAGLGPEDPDLDATLAAVELHGRAWHGLPPRDSEGWRLAEAMFGTDALEEISRWAEEDGAADG